MAISAFFLFNVAASVSVTAPLESPNSFTAYRSISRFFFGILKLHLLIYTVNGREDYRRGGFQMVAVNDPHGLRTASLIQEYSLYLTALPIIVSASGVASWMFAVEGGILHYLL